ncbi:MAG TPA: TetR/AcrR family transcriptional regulator [Pseudonocardiaceae bacterium]
MSPRRVDPGLPIALVEAAARLLAEGGPTALTTRRLAAAVGKSTMAVYTHFGGMDDLVRAMVHEGFARLHQRLGTVDTTDDPVADVITLGYAYRGNALEYPHLYAVMFGSSALGGFELTDEDRQHGRYTLRFLVNAVRRAMTAGRFRVDDPQLVAQHMWIALHGLVTLELGGYLVDPYGADACYQGQLYTLLAGSGDELAATKRSMERGQRRYLSAPADAVSEG